MVAVEAADLDPETWLARYLASVPAVADRVRRLRALRRHDELAPDLGPAKADEITAKALGVSSRTVRRWRTGH